MIYVWIKIGECGNVRIQSNPIPNTFGYFGTQNEKNTGKNEGILSLFLDEDENKTNGKPRFEIRHEGGYIRKYVVKANGDETLVMETKQKENPDGTVQNESGDLKDMASDMLMKQLEISSDFQNQDGKSMSVWDKENSIFKYKTGI